MTTITKPDYSRAQEAAYQILKDSKAKIFPIEPMDIILSLGARVMTYEEFAAMHQITIDETCKLLKSDDGATWERQNGRKIIFYNTEGVSPRRIRFTLAHELGHIVLGHISENNAGVAISDEQYDAYEKELITLQRDY